MTTAMYVPGTGIVIIPEQETKSFAVPTEVVSLAEKYGEAPDEQLVGKSYVENPIQNVTDHELAAVVNELTKALPQASQPVEKKSNQNNQEPEDVGKALAEGDTVNVPERKSFGVVKSIVGEDVTLDIGGRRHNAQ